MKGSGKPEDNRGQRAKIAKKDQLQAADNDSDSEDEPIDILVEKLQ